MCLKKTVYLVFIVLTMIVTMHCKGGKDPVPAEKTQTNTLLPAAQYADWDNYSIPGVCKFQAPKTLEVKGKLLQEFKEELGKIWGYTGNPNSMTLQQRGLNDFDPKASKQYCRVIIDTQKGQIGEFPRLTDKITFTPEELLQLDQEFAAAMELDRFVDVIEKFPFKVVKVNGIDALLVSYRRVLKEGDDKPVWVDIYSFNNYNTTHMITMSYRESEADLWKADLNKMISTFVFE